MDLLTKIKKAPIDPGCYLFKNKLDRVIYVGKAKDLNKRVAWYFRRENQIGKIADLAREITAVDFVVVDNEIEALLLEAELIKKHQPKYNIQLKSGVRYAYIRLTKDVFPRLETARIIKKTDQVFGPYTSGSSRQQAWRLANSLFKLRICRKLPKRACLLYHINQCSAPCIGQISEKDYAKNVTGACMLLKGQNKELIALLKKEMQEFSQKQQYELAKIKRDQILALENISQKQKVSLHKKYNQDVIGYLRSGKYLLIQLFNINKGIVSGRKEFKLSSGLSADDRENFAAFIKQYYFTNEIPQELIIPKLLPDQELVKSYLGKMAKRKITITVPQKGNKAKLLNLVNKNILVSLRSKGGGLLELQEKLSLPNLPSVIECFDISNLGPTDVVGSSVNFLDGQPDKNNYRRYKIKTFTGQSDYDGIKEIIYRRYYGLKKGLAKMPDLVIVDGGRPQLSAALASLRELGLDLPVIGLAKKQEEIYTPNNRYPIRLPRQSAALKQLQKIRDEAHRFAITYQKLLRQKRIIPNK